LTTNMFIRSSSRENACRQVVKNLLKKYLKKNRKFPPGGKLPLSIEKFLPNNRRLNDTGDPDHHPLPARAPGFVPCLQAATSRGCRRLWEGSLWSALSVLFMPPTKRICSPEFRPSPVRAPSEPLPSPVRAPSEPRPSIHLSGCFQTGFVMCA
jgi:hypothetical protein